MFCFLIILFGILLVNRGTIPVSEAYKECNIQEEFTPAGKPTFNPVELLFGYLGWNRRKRFSHI
jgi:transposase